MPENKTRLDPWTFGELHPSGMSHVTQPPRPTGRAGPSAAAREGNAAGIEAVGLCWLAHFYLCADTCGELERAGTGRSATHAAAFWALLPPSPSVSGASGGRPACSRQRTEERA